MPTGVYARLSPRADKGDSIADQVRDGTRYARQLWPAEQVLVFEDRKRSGTTMADRPGLAALLEAVAAGTITQLCIRHQDRLTRGEWVTLSAVLLKADITHVHTWPREGIPSGVIEVESDAVALYDFVNGMEARKIKKNTIAKLADLKQSGRHLGTVPFGYVSTGPKYRRKLEQVPKQAAELRQMYERIIAGWSLAAVAADLNRRNVTTARGFTWRHANLRKLLDSPKLAGLDSAGRPLAADAVDPILTEDEWRHLQHVIHNPRTVVRLDGLERITAVNQRQQHAYPLTGLLECPRGCRMVGHAKSLPNGKPPRPTYQCDHALLQAELTEAYVVGEYLNGVTTPAFLAALAQDAGADDRDRIGRKLEALAAQRLALAGNVDLEPDEYTARRSAIRARETKLRAELAELPPSPARADPTVVRDAWEFMTAGEQREFLGIWLEKVSVAPADTRAPRRDREALAAWVANRLTMVWRTA